MLQYVCGPSMALLWPLMSLQWPFNGPLMALKWSCNGPSLALVSMSRNGCHVGKSYQCVVEACFIFREENIR